MENIQIATTVIVTKQEYTCVTRGFLMCSASTIFRQVVDKYLFFLASFNYLSDCIWSSVCQLWTIMSLLSTRHVSNTLDVFSCKEHLSFRTKGQSEACCWKWLQTKHHGWCLDNGWKLHSPLNVNQPHLSSIKDKCVKEFSFIIHNENKIKWVSICLCMVYFLQEGAADAERIQA